MAAQENDPAFTDEELTRIEEITRGYLEASGTPAALVGIWIPDRGTLVTSYGLAELENTRTATPDDAFRIASNTKTFVATLLLQLVDEGKLTLDTPISDFGIDLPGSEAATIAQLLGMTSGIFSYTEDEKFAAGYFADPAMEFDPEDALAIAREHGPDFAPGEGIHYSDTGYIVAGQIVEQVTGSPIEQQIRDRFLSPYSLHGTSFPTDPAMPDPHLDGYQPVEGSDEPMDVTASNPNAAWAAGAMISTLADMKTWLELLTDGSLLSPELQKVRMQTTPVVAGKPLSYGLGIMELFGFYGHNGGIAGYSTFMLRDPNDGATIIIATNLSDEHGGGADSIAIQLLDYLLPDRFAMNAPGVGTPAASPVSS